MTYSLGKNIKLCRVLKGLRQKELANEAGISVSYLSLLERDKRNPSLSTLQKITTTLSISLPTFFFLAADSDGLEKIDSNLAHEQKTFYICSNCEIRVRLGFYEAQRLGWKWERRVGSRYDYYCPKCAIEAEKK